MGSKTTRKTLTGHPVRATCEAICQVQELFYISDLFLYAGRWCPNSEPFVLI